MKQLDVRLLHIHIILHHCLKKMENKIFLSNGCVFIPCLPIEFELKRMLARVSDREIFSLNCSKFAVESDWNSKNSQNVQIFF